jgi:hypothetical protein
MEEGWSNQYCGGIYIQGEADATTNPKNLADAGIVLPAQLAPTTKEKNHEKDCPMHRCGDGVSVLLLLLVGNPRPCQPI